MNSRWYTFVFTSCLCLTGCSGEDSESGTQPSDYDFTSFDLAVESFLAETELEGATAVVVHKRHGVLHERGYGSFAANRVSLIASASKVLSAGVLVHLADQGLVDLDAPIGQYIPSEWGESKADLTLAQLLSNSSGLLGLVDNPTYAPYICQYIPVGTLSDCAESIYTAEDAADRVPPDTKFRYGGGQWQLAGAIASIVTGKTWDELLAETYGPCGVTGLGYTNQYMRAFTGGGGLESALGYPTFFSGDVSTLDVTDNPSIEGGAYTSIGDYGRILLMHLRGGECDGGRVMEPESVARMQEDRIAAYGGRTLGRGALAGYGFGWWVDRENPGVVADPGAYGAVPWIDNVRDYAAMVIIEGPATASAMERMKPAADAIFDGAGK